MKARWRRPGIEASWRQGKIILDAGGPDVIVRGTYTGALYTIDRKYVQVEIVGPRGGRKWEALPVEDEDD